MLRAMYMKHGFWVVWHKLKPFHLCRATEFCVVRPCFMYTDLHDDNLCQLSLHFATFAQKFGQLCTRDQCYLKNSTKS
jgi:hypothetical protein